MIGGHDVVATVTVATGHKRTHFGGERTVPLEVGDEQGVIGHVIPLVTKAIRCIA